MKKKFLSMVLMAVMALSLTACGTKNTASGDAVKAVLDKMSATETNGMSMVFEMSMDDEYIGFKMDVVSGDGDTAVCKVDAKMNLEGMELKDYTPVTDCIVVDEKCYVNVASIFDFLAELEPQFAMLAAYYELPGDYVVLTMDDLTEIYSDFLGVDIDFAELMETGLTESDDTNPALEEALTDVVCRFVEELAAKEGSGITVSGSKISLSLNEKTMQDFMNALASIDVEEYCMQYAEAVDKIEGGVDYTAAMQQEIKGLNNAIKDAAEDMNEFTDGEKVNINVDMGVEGKKNVVSASIKVKDSSDDMNITFSVTTSPDKNSNVSAPNSIMTYDELMEVFGY